MKKAKINYIDNVKFSEAIIEYQRKAAENKTLGKPEPKISNYIGECFQKIAEHLSYRPEFINYSYREEMVGDGVENCLMYFENYNPEAISKRTGNKTLGAFAYFSQIIFFAFLRRIAKEQKEQYVKYKILQKSQIMDQYTAEDIESMSDDLIKNYVQTGGLYDNMNDFIVKYEESQKRKKIKIQEKKNPPVANAIMQQLESD